MNEKKDLITMNYGLINGKYKLKAEEQNFIFLLLNKIHKNDTNFKHYEFSKNEIEQMLGTKQNAVRIKDLARGLMGKTLEIESKTKWKIFTWFSTMGYEDGILEVKISNDMKPFLLELKGKFVQSELAHLLHLKSYYSKRIYGLLNQYKNLKTRTIELTDLQNMLQTPKSFNVYNDFKRKVLEVAMKEINEKTDLNFTYTPIKLGRKVTSIKFNIKINK